MVLLQGLKTKDVKFIWLTNSGRAFSLHFSLHVSPSSCCRLAQHTAHSLVGSRPTTEHIYVLVFTPPQSNKLINKLRRASLLAAFCTFEFLCDNSCAVYLESADWCNPVGTDQEIFVACWANQKTGKSWYKMFQRLSKMRKYCHGGTNANSELLTRSTK